MTLGEPSIDLQAVKLDSRATLCFGSEVPGLTDAAHDLADEFIKVPMFGFTQSFNLSVCAGISLNLLTTQLRESKINWQLDGEDKLNLIIDWLSKSTPTGKVLLDKFIEACG
jgi:tRNA (guanosine-2'-O-)-methyltransferase